MAVVTPTFRKLRGVTGGIEAVVVTWATIGDADTCTPVSLPELADKSIQAEGTFSSAVISFRGSNDATTNANGNYEVLNDPFANALTLSAAGLKQCTEASAWIKPTTATGSGSSVTVTVMCRRSIR